MSNELKLIFKTEDIKRLIAEDTEFIVVRSFIESVVLKDGSKAGAVRVFADAMKKGQPGAEFSVSGCPWPPCTTDDDPEK